MLDRFFGIDAVIVIEFRHAFKGARAMQTIRCRDFLCAFNILLIDSTLARIVTLRTSVHAGVRRVGFFAPEKIFRLNFAVAFFTRRLIQRFQMRAESLVAFLGGFEFGKRGVEIRFGGRIRRDLQQKARDGIVHRDKHAIPRARGFERESRGESEWVE